MNKERAMNKEQASGTWKKVKGEIKGKWGKLTDDEIESLKGNLDELVGLLQNAYGYAKEKAEQEYEDFKNSLDVVWDEVKRNKSFGFIAALSLASLVATTSLLTLAIFRKKNC